MFPRRLQRTEVKVDVQLFRSVASSRREYDECSSYLSTLLVLGQYMSCVPCVSEPLVLLHVIRSKSLWQSKPTKGFLLMLSVNFYNVYVGSNVRARWFYYLSCSFSSFYERNTVKWQLFMWYITELCPCQFGSAWSSLLVSREITTKEMIRK